MQDIEDTFSVKKTAEAVFINPAAAYDTVRHHLQVTEIHT